MIFMMKKYLKVTFSVLTGYGQLCKKLTVFFQFFLFWCPWSVHFLLEKSPLCSFWLGHKRMFLQSVDLLRNLWIVPFLWRDGWPEGQLHLNGQCSLNQLSTGPYFIPEKGCPVHPLRDKATSLSPKRPFEHEVYNVWHCVFMMAYTLAGLASEANSYWDTSIFERIDFQWYQLLIHLT